MTIETDRPDHYRFQFGDMTVATILDGYVHMDEPHETFGLNVEKAELDSLLHANFLPTDRFENTFTPVVVETGDEVIAFDTGNPDGRLPTAGKFRERLSTIGRKLEDITLVVITHGHPDHIGGLMTDGQPSFPNARYMIGRIEYEFWSSDERMGTPAEVAAQLFRSNVVPLKDKITFIEDGDEVLPGIRAMHAPGHTPGHMIFTLESGGEKLLLWADTTNHYVASLERPDWHPRFDLDKETAVETRKHVLEMAAAERLTVIGHHMPFPAVGHVEKTVGSYRWVPVSYQLNL